jgi:spore maturation protein A
MKSMQKLNPHPDEATKDMCSFMIINMSSLQLIPINMLAYRVNFGSADPTAIVGPTLVATMASTIAAIIYTKIRYRFTKE